MQSATKDYALSSILKKNIVFPSKEAITVLASIGSLKSKLVSRMADYPIYLLRLFILVFDLKGL